MLFIRLSIILMLFSAYSLTVAQKKVLLTPKDFSKPLQHYDEGILKERAEDPWIVFSDKDENTLFKNSSCTNSSGTKLGFLQPFYAMEESFDAIKLADPAMVKSDGTLKNENYDGEGWVLKKNLLLWMNCLNAPVRVGEYTAEFNKKAMVINRVDISIDQQQEGEKITKPYYFSVPVIDDHKIIDKANVFKIEFVFKETDDFVLLSTVPSINYMNQIKSFSGWVSKEKITPWNHRLAFEENWDQEAFTFRERNKCPIKIFENQNDALRFYSEYNIKGRTAFKEKKIYKKRISGNKPRYPILTESADTTIDVPKLGIMGDLKLANLDSISPERFAEILDEVRNIALAMRKVNVLFVIDGTESMWQYKSSVMNALRIAMRELTNSSQSYSFGALVFRDAPEALITEISNMGNLTQNPKIIIDFLDTTLVKEKNRKDMDHPEALFFGLNQAVTTFNPDKLRTNYIILIGDTENNPIHEETNVPEPTLINSLLGIQANFLAFQVHHKNDSAFDNFRTQIPDLFLSVAKLNAKKIYEALNDEVYNPKNIYLKSSGDTIFLNKFSSLKGRLYKAPNGGSLGQLTLQKGITKELINIDFDTEAKIEALQDALMGDSLSSENYVTAGIINDFIEGGLSFDEIMAIIQAASQMYKVGYTSYHPRWSPEPQFQYVGFISEKEVRKMTSYINRAVPPGRIKPPNETRNDLYTIYEKTLIRDLKYLKDVHDFDTTSLGQITTYITGFPSNPVYKNIKAKDLYNYKIFPDSLMYAYLSDLVITKGHLTSLIKGNNHLNLDFLNEHKSYLYRALGWADRNLRDEDRAAAKLRAIAGNYREFDGIYESYPVFNLKIGDTEESRNYYWLDTRIFPHEGNDFINDALNQ